jgi:type IV secretion system protein VirB6
MSLNPIGTFVQRFDAALTGSIDGIIGAMVTYASAPIGLCAVLYYVIQGMKFAQGDAEVLHAFWGRLIKIGTLVWLTSNLSAFNLWIRDLVFLGIPNALNVALGPAMGAAPGTVTSTAAMFDNVWSQLWEIVGMVWMQMGFSVTGMLAGVVGVLTILFGGGGLLVIAMVYLGARMVFAVLVCLAPIIMILAIFEATKGVVERAIGKAIALIILQVAGFIVMEIVLLGNQWFMARATEAILLAVGHGAVLAEALQILLSVCAWFLAGAYGMWQIRAVAYSLGSGVMLPGPSAYALSLLSRIGGGGRGGPATPGPAPAGPLSIDLARPALSSSQPALSPPARPPALSHSTRS